MYRTLKEIYHQTQTCQKCELWETRNSVVFGEGSIRANIMMIGEGPGQVEDELGRPFVGPAGQLLSKILQCVDLKREEIYITNVVKCRPPKNRVPRPEECSACMNYLRGQVALIRPKIIVCLGKVAASAIISEDFKITRLRGTVYERKGFYIIPTFHPSALLRDESKKKYAYEDFKKIAQLDKQLKMGQE